jgi:hypothetical protein
MLRRTFLTALAALLPASLIAPASEWVISQAPDIDPPLWTVRHITGVSISPFSSKTSAEKYVQSGSAASLVRLANRPTLPS